MNNTIKFKVKKRLFGTEHRVFIGYEQLNNRGDWECKRNGNETWIEGVFSIINPEMRLERYQFTGFNDAKGNELYNEDSIIHLSNPKLIGKIFRQSPGEWMIQYEGGVGVLANKLDQIERIAN
jgi:hypothetical protein